jgi:hypothetical protein
LLLASLITGIVSTLAYLRTSPLPPLDATVQETTTKQVATQGALTVATESTTRTTTPTAVPVDPTISVAE